MSVLDDCTTLPLSLVSIFLPFVSLSVTIQGPIGQKVSKLFERVRCASFFCRSLAVTSLMQVRPKI